MASIQNLKKDIHNTLGDLIEACYVWEYTTPNADASKAQAIIDEAVAAFDVLMDDIHAKNVENKKAHFKAIGQSLEKTANTLIDKINAL